MRVVRTAVLLTALCTSPAFAQDAGAGNAFTRARDLVSNGSAAAGRIIIDSVLAAAPRGSDDFVEALYWRAAFTSSPDDAARDYRRLIVDYPYAARTGDALLALGRSTLATGDRRSAATYFERFFAGYPNHPEHVESAATVVRTLAALEEWPRACAALRVAMRTVPAGRIELRNQLEFFQPRCARLADEPARAAPPAAAPPPRTSDSATATRTMYTVQVAAHDRRSDADRVATTLRGRGYDARVIGTAKPFRVRVGRVPSRAEADAVARELRTRGYQTYVTAIGSEER